jgi:hypothetical protein
MVQVKIYSEAGPRDTRKTLECATGQALVTNNARQTRTHLQCQLLPTLRSAPPNGSSSLLKGDDIHDISSLRPTAYSPCICPCPQYVVLDYYI